MVQTTDAQSLAGFEKFPDSLLPSLGSSPPKTSRRSSRPSFRTRSRQTAKNLPTTLWVGFFLHFSSTSFDIIVPTTDNPAVGRGGGLECTYDSHPSLHFTLHFCVAHPQMGVSGISWFPKFVNTYCANNKRPLSIALITPCDAFASAKHFSTFCQVNIFLNELILFLVGKIVRLQVRPGKKCSLPLFTKTASTTRRNNDMLCV